MIINLYIDIPFYTNFFKTTRLKFNNKKKDILIWTFKIYTKKSTRNLIEYLSGVCLNINPDAFKL